MEGMKERVILEVVSPTRFRTLTGAAVVGIDDVPDETVTLSDAIVLRRLL